MATESRVELERRFSCKIGVRCYLKYQKASQEMKEPWVCGQCGILVSATNQKPEYTYLEKMGCCRLSKSNPSSGPSLYEHHLRVLVHKNQILGSVEEALYYHDAADWLRVNTLTESLDSPWEEITDAFSKAQMRSHVDVVSVERCREPSLEPKWLLAF